MIKKKTPVLWATLVGTMLLVIVMINLSQYLSSPGRVVEIKQPNEEALAKIKERQSQVTGQGGATLMSAMGIKGFGPEAVAAQEKQPNPEKPSIKIPDTKDHKPDFYAHTTSSQWYDPTSYQQAQAKAKEGLREDANDN